MVGRSWSSDDESQLCFLSRKGITNEDLAARFGRTIYGIKSRLRLLRMSPAERASREHQKVAHRLHEQPDRPVIPQCVIDDRDHRSMLPPRDLTAALLGDPPVGYSALERR